MFDFAHYGNTVFRPAKRWADKQRIDIIIFDEAIDRKELEDNLRTGKSVTTAHEAQLINMIIKYSDCFRLRGARRTILDYEFSIDTGASPPVCCRLPIYGPHEKPIIMELINSLIDNDWIDECGGE